MDYQETYENGARGTNVGLGGTGRNNYASSNPMQQAYGSPGYNGFGIGFGGRGNSRPAPKPAAPQEVQPNLMPMAAPFTSAMSGTQSGTLQPYINQLTQQGSDALYGGLLNYQPQPMMAGAAGGVPQPSQVPQFNMPQGLLDEQMFAPRPWMGV